MTISTSSRLTRSSVGYLGGVCEGLGKQLNLNPNFFRVAWIAAIFLWGTGLFLYGLLWWLLPEDRDIPIEPSIWEAGSDGIRRPPLKRTIVDRKIFGVCGGIARRWDLDPTAVRLGVVALSIASFGTTAIFYGIAALLLPTQAMLPINYEPQI